MTFAIKPNADGTAELLVDGVSRVKINADGGVKTNAPVFSAYTNATTNISAGTFTKIAFQLKEFDSHNFFNVATGRFQPLVAGYYYISGAVRAPSSSSEVAVLIYKNGVESKRGTNLAASAVELTVGALVYLNGTSDYVEMYVYSAVAISTGFTPSQTYFQGHLVEAA